MAKGRTQAVIDWKKVDRFLQAQCDGVGIAGIIGIHPNTLYEACKKLHKISFSEYSAIKKSEGKELLKAKQYQVAMEGDRTMLVWLGKQLLDQKDKAENKSTGTILNINVEVDSQETADELKKLVYEPQTN